MRKYLVKVSVILSFVFMILILGFASSNNKVYAKTYDKTPENCTHNLAQVTAVTKNPSSLVVEQGYKNDGVAKGSTGVGVFYPKNSGNVTTPGTSEVTIEVVLDEAKTINVYYLFQRQRAQYCRAYVTITHDGVAGSEVEIVNQNWNIDTVECHAGTNTLKYKCRVTKGSWGGPGRRFWVIPDYVPSFDENDRCTQCGLQCDHKESSMHYDDNNHWYQCDDLCGKTFESTKHEHEYDEDNQCVVCGVVNMQKDANDYYLISNPAELATFTKYVNVDGKTNIKGKLTADLNLKDVNFEPIGNSARVFVGEFDGGNHRIYNLNLVEENYSGAGLGFFGYAGSTSTGTAKISNLTIDKSCSFASNKVTAALVGYVNGTINIDHCGNEANVTSLNPSAVNSISAGLVAFGNEGIVNMTYCYNTGTIIGGSGYYGLADDNAFYYGSAGLIGYVQAFNIDYSYNAGNVTTTICENDGKYQYVKESYHMTSFGNATGAAGAKVGENCYNYEAVNYGDGNGTVTKYSSITDSSILTALNTNNQDGVKFVQDTDYPILATRKVFVDSKHCKHDYEVSRYEWADDYSKCKGIAACKNCGDTLVEEQNSTKTTINAPGELGLQMTYYTVVFENNTVFAPQKTLVEYSMAPTHKITLNANGGTGTPCAFYYEGFGTDLPYDYIKDGHYIEGWYLNADFTGEKVTKILATEKEDKVLYAKYEEHTCTLENFDAVAPTCTTNGMTAGQRCSVCGTIREGGEVILALGHDFVITTDAASITARCSREGCNEAVTISLVRKDTGVEITNTEAWMAHGFLVPTVYYVGTGTTVYESTPVMPNVKGTYKATMTYEGKTAELEYLMKKQLDPTKKTDLDLPDHSPLYDDDEISVDTDVEDITIEWFYDDNEDGIPDSETPIGTGTTYVVKCPDENNPTHDDRGHKIIAKVTQNKKEDGTDYEEDKKPVQYSNPVLVYTPLVPNPENKPEIEVPGDKDEVEDGDVISADVDYTPITVKWYYDDDNDGNPDNPNNPIGVGQTYEIKVPDKEDETHNDKGHKIIGVITQDKKPDGTSYPEGEAPTVTTKPVQVAGKLPVEKAIKAGEFYFLGDTIIFSENVFVVSNPELIVAQKAGKVIVTYNIQYNTEVEFTDMLLGTDNIKRTIYAGTLSPITSIADVLGLKCVSGDGTENNPYVFKAFTKGDYYSPLDPTKKTELDLPNHSPLYGDDEISVDTDATEVTVEWFYDDNGDGIPDSETPIGTGTTYTVKCPDENNPTHDDRGHKIIAKVTQNKKEDGTDYEEGQKPVQYSNPVLVYTPFVPNPENKTEVEIPNDKPKAEDGDELSVDVTVKPVTVKWYYDDNDDGIPDDLDNPIGEGLTYTVKCPDENNPTHDDTGHKIIAVITQDKKPDGTAYPEGDAPREITDSIIVKGNVGGYKPLDPTVHPAITTPNHEPLLHGDEISIDIDAKPVTVEWFYDDNEDGTPDTLTPIGTGTTYIVKCPDENDPTHDDRGHKIMAVIIQTKDEDGEDLETPLTQTSNTVSAYLPFTPNPENKTEIELPNDKPKAEDGDELSVDVTVKPVTVKWYYDDNDDGIPDDLDNPIGEGLTYTVKCPDTNNPNHDDTGHKIIAVITQDKKPDGTDYQEGDAPREITDPIIVKGNVGGFEELDTTNKPDINIPEDKEEADIEDVLSVDTTSKPIEVKWYYDDNNDGKPDFTTPIGEGLTYQIISQDPDNPAHNDTGHKIIAVITQNKNEDGDYLPTAQIKTVTSNPIKVAGVIPHTHNFTYKANGTTITAKCTNSYCLITEGLTLTLQAPEGDMVYDGNPRVATLAEGYSEIAFPDATIKYYLGNKEVASCIDAGKYTAKVTFGNATVSVTFTIENWKEADEAHPEVKAEIVGAAEDENVHIKVEVKTTITAEATPADYDAVKAKLESDEQITTVYEVKLIRTINGADTVIQPSDLEDGATIIVTMNIPDGVKIGSFRILHIHGPNDTEFIDDFTVIGRTVQFKVSRLSEFAFVIKTTPSNHGFCGGWVLFIFVILQLLFLCFFCLLPLFNKKNKLVGKVDLFKLIGLGSSIVVLFIAVIVLALDACTVAVVSAILSALVCVAYIVFTIIDLVRIPARN